MEFKGLIISLKELNIAKEEDPERFVMEDGLTELLDGLHHYQVQTVNLDLFKADTKEKLLTVLALHQLLPEECLMIAATEGSLEMIEGLPIASIGYCVPGMQQDLSKAQLLAEGFEEVDFYFLEQIYQRKHGIPWTVIETKRCYLREMTIEDLDDLYRIYEGESITRYMEGLYPQREQEEEYTRAYIQQMYQFYGYGVWLVVRKEDDRIIGRAGLNNVEIHGVPSLEMGYLIEEESQKKGYGTEVCEGIIQFAKGTGFSQLNCLIHKENQKSICLARKLGFVWVEELFVKETVLQRYCLELLIEGN